MTLRALLLVTAAITAGGCARGDAGAPGTSNASHDAAGGPVQSAVPAVVCPAHTERKTRATAEGTETYCLQTLAQTPNVDVGPATIQTGPSVTRRLDGTVSAYGEYGAGVKTGLWRTFHPDGSRMTEGRYDDRGRRTGPWSLWRSGGKLLTEATYAEGRLEGPWRNVWGGVVVGEGAFLAGLPSGAWTSRFCTGGTRQTIALAAGTLDGPCARYEPAGRRYLEGGYHAGKKSGVWRQSASNGVHFESMWSDDVRDGPFRWWSAEGVVVMEGALRRGQLDGRWVLRDAGGQVTKEGVYADGKLADGADIVSVPKLDGYESNAYCAANLAGFSPLPTSGGAGADDEGDLTKVVCEGF